MKYLNSHEFEEIINGLNPSFPINENGLLHITDISVSDAITISSLKQNMENISVVIGDNSIFESYLELSNLTFKSFEIRGNSKFHDDLRISEITCTGSFAISKVQILGNLDINWIEARTIGFRDFSCENDFELSFLNQQKFVKIYNPTIKGSLIIYGSLSPSNIEMIVRGKKCHIGLLNLQNSSNVEITSFGECLTIDEILITGRINENDVIRLNSISASKISLENLHNQGYIHFNQILNTSNFVMNGKDIGNLFLENSDFRETEFLIQSSNLENLKLINCTPPSPSKININLSLEDNNKIETLQIFKKIFDNKGNNLLASRFHEEELLTLEKRENDINRKDIYSQLKKMYEQRGDSVKSLEYQAKEMEIHMNSPEISWSERWNLKFAYWSNNFGTDWMKALKFLLKWSIPIYLIFIFLQGHRPGTDWELFLDIVANYFEYLNPLRRSDFFVTNNQSEKINSWARIVDFFARIFIAFAEYQLIQAFRKYGKK